MASDKNDAKSPLVEKTKKAGSNDDLISYASELIAEFKTVSINSPITLQPLLERKF